MSNRPSSTKPGRRRPPGSSSARVAQARQGGGAGRWWAVAGVAVVVVGALLVAILATRSSEPQGVASAGFDLSSAENDLVRGSVQVNGTPLAELPPAAAGSPAADPAVGQTTPEVTGQLFNGEPITIPASGRPKVVMVMAHWCPHCQEEVPELTAHLGGTLPDDVDLFTVASGTAENRPNFPPGDWLRRESWPVPTLVDDGNGTAANAYGLSGYPFFVAADASGQVVARHSGRMTAEQFDSFLAMARG